MFEEIINAAVDLAKYVLIQQLTFSDKMISSLLQVFLVAVIHADGRTEYWLSVIIL